MNRMGATKSVWRRLIVFTVLVSLADHKKDPIAKRRRDRKRDSARRTMQPKKK